MPNLRLSGRKAAVVGLCAAAATTALVAVAVPATAAPSELTTCTDTVRVRSQPSASAPVIGSCSAGERVTVDETRNGFAHLVNKQGWASVDFVDLKDVRSSNRDDEDDRFSSDEDDDFDSRNDDEFDSRNDDDFDDDNSDDGLLGGLN
ncbi:MAG: SH3 domain-containing protein [Pseudonocardia sp.]|jgi:uncharacterized protein YraI